MTLSPNQIAPQSTSSSNEINTVSVRTKRPSPTMLKTPPKKLFNAIGKFVNPNPINKKFAKPTPFLDSQSGFIYIGSNVEKLSPHQQCRRILKQLGRIIITDKNIKNEVKDGILLINALIKANSFDPETFDILFRFFDSLRTFNFGQAKSAYMSLAIGSQAWSIGFTAVGIHARAHRDKIAQDKITHRMNNPTYKTAILTLHRLLISLEELCGDSIDRPRLIGEIVQS